jgi:uncharacterized membrane protein YccC
VKACRLQRRLNEEITARFDQFDKEMASKLADVENRVQIISNSSNPNQQKKEGAV